MIISLGADHGGFELKNRLSEFLRSEGHEVIDNGTNSPDSVDYPDFAKGWHRNLDRHYLHPASLCILPKKEMKEMVNTIWDIVEKYVKETGIDIDRRIAENPEKYHMNENNEHATLAFQRRIGGQMCERIVSAWIDWKYPNQKEIPMVTTQQPLKHNEP